MIHRLVLVGAAIGSLFYAFPICAQEDDVVAGSSADPPAHLSPGEAFKGAGGDQTGSVSPESGLGDPGDSAVINRGYLGVRIQPMTGNLADSLGLAHNRGELVQAVQPGNAAAQAGIQAGDVVVRVNGQEVSPQQTLSSLVANTKPGSQIPVEIIRNGTHMTLTVTVGHRPQ